MSSQRLRYNDLAPEGLAALRSFEHYLNTGTLLPAALRELVRLRASQLNGCAFCMEMHKHELGKHNEPASRIDAVANWREANAFTPRECAALAWTEVITNVQATHASDEEYAAVSEFFTGKELVDLTLTIASINSWNRIAIAFRAEWKADPQPQAKEAAATGEAESTDALGDDGGKVARD